MKEKEHESRDLGLMVLILLLGLLFMLVAGQKATQLLPDWSIPADMNSNLDPNARFRSRSESGGLEPLRPEILTPPTWNDSYLTPMPDGAAVETTITVVVFDPSATPSVTPSTSPTTTVTVTSTPNPTNTPTSTTTTVPTNTNTGDKDPRPSPTPSLPPPVTSTIDTSTLSEIAPPPADLDVGSPDGTAANLNSGTYTVVDVTQGGVDPAITVVGPSDTNYDLVYYEWDTGSGIMLDDVIVGISQDSDGDPYYEVFNWGDGNPDENTSADTGDLGVDPSEIDNQAIAYSDLYPDPPAPGPQTGILIDVDNADSHPPPGDYPYVVIISPSTGGDAAQVDAVELVDEPPPP